MSTTTDYEDTTPAKTNGEVSVSEPLLDEVSDYDPLNLNSVRAEAMESLGVSNVPSSVRIRRPGTTEFEWFRVNPDPAYSAILKLYRLKGDDRDANDIYAPTQDVLPYFVDRLRDFQFVTCTNLNKVTFLWAIPLPHGGKTNGWNDSANSAAKRAMGEWTRIEADMARGEYLIKKAENNNKWPKPSFDPRSLDELYRAAMKNNIIDSEDHWIVKKIRGVD
jgi:hypothetical protein